MEPKPLPIIIAVLVLIVAIAGLWFVLTRESTYVPPEPAPIDGSQGVTKQEIHDEGEYYEVSGSYPSSAGLTATAGAKEDALAVSYMKLFIEQELERFKDTNVNELSAQDIEIQGLGGDRRYTLDIDYDFYQSDETVSYVYHMYADTMGAHPNVYYRTFTFDRATGEGLALDDIFSPTADYLGVLSTLSREKLPLQLEALSGVAPDADMLAAGTTPDADNFQNFYLKGDAVVIIFPPYQIGPWVLGVQEVSLTRAELGSTLKAEYR
jgi:Protein of unknown function (DUF3298)